ncbi:MAG: SIS domain-containing protein, partial [Verrucomicrobia bacterium]|nr:SIS domain-containing protein [Verrucomicrobiota bacterium]
MASEETPAEQARAFLEIADQFRLGELPTEQSHPWTQNLSQWVQSDLPGALEMLHRVDRKALGVVLTGRRRIADLAGSVARTLRGGGRIFLAGCGATGRLALTLEALCRRGWIAEPYRGSVVGFMAGGDAALIRSLEGFEDRPDYGRRQLEELGFTENDLLIGITEGGETPFVIAATEHAAELSRRPPWFCYCNPDGMLKAVAARSARILARTDIERLPLPTGPMALAGSTRMQAATVQLAALGLALRYQDDFQGLAVAAEELVSFLRALDYTLIAPFIEAEAAAVKAGTPILYQTDTYGLTVLTDTTERSPTFSLHPFENTRRPDQPASQVYLAIPSQADAASAWANLLGRPPRTLEWPEVAGLADDAHLMGYDISRMAATHRRGKTGKESRIFAIGDRPEGVHMDFAGLSLTLPSPRDALSRNLALKLLLNANSTSVAGLCGRYEGNCMTWVKPSNFKLIDRAIRYIRQLRGARGQPDPGYEAVCRALFEVRATLPPDASIVLETLKRLEMR